MALSPPGPTSISADTPEWFRPPAIQTLPRPRDPDEILRTSPTRAQAVVYRGNMDPASPIRHERITSRTRHTIHTDDRAAKNRYTDPDTIEYRAQEAYKADPTCFRKARSPLNSFMENAVFLKNLIPIQSSHQRLSTLRENLPRRLAKSTSADNQELQRLYKSGCLTAALHAGSEIPPEALPAPKGPLFDPSPMAGKLGVSDSDAGKTSPYKRDPWMAGVDKEVTSPLGMSFALPQPTALFTKPPSVSPVRSSVARHLMPAASAESSSFLKLPVGHRPWTSALSALKAAGKFKNLLKRKDGEAPALASTVPHSNPTAMPGRTIPAAATSKAKKGKAKGRSTAVLDTRKALVAKGLIQSRNLLRINGQDPGAGYFDSGAWEDIVDPHEAARYARRAEAEEAKLTRSQTAEPRSRTRNPSSRSSRTKPASSPSASPSSKRGPFSPQRSVQFEDALLTPSSSRSKEPIPAEFDELERFETQHKLFSPAHLPKRKLVEKIKYSGDMVALGFADESALESAPRHDLVVAAEVLSERKRKKKAAEAEAAARAAQARAVEEAMEATNLRVGDDTTSGRVRLTPRSMRTMTKANFFG